MRRRAALASSLIAGFASLAGCAAEAMNGRTPAVPPASSPPRTMRYLSFTSSPSFALVYRATSLDAGATHYAIVKELARLTSINHSRRRRDVAIRDTTG